MPTERFAHFPFLYEDSTALTPGSFLTGSTEDALVAAVWRLRRWNFYGSLTWHAHDPLIGDFPAFSGSDPSYISNGESNLSGFETSAFGSTDDILEAWRQTRSVSTGVHEVSAAVDIWWGPRGSYDISGATGGGILDSELLFAFEVGDFVVYLGSQQGRAVGGGGVTLSQESDVSFSVTDAAGVEQFITLYYDDQTDGGDLFTDTWTGNLFLLPGDLWWPWTIDGDDTWDVSDGSQLLDPLRNDSNGFPLRYLCQQA